MCPVFENNNLAIITCYHNLFIIQIIYIHYDNYANTYTYQYVYTYDHETPDDQAGRLEADRMRLSEQAKSSRDPVHREKRLEAERNRSSKARIPTQAEDPETNYVISLCSPFNACIHLVYNHYDNYANYANT